MHRFHLYLCTYFIQGIKTPFGFSIYSDQTGAIKVQPQALRSDDASKGEPISFLPTFPNNFPTLVTPQKVDLEVQKDTLAACNTVTNTQTVQDFYEDFFANWYSQDLAEHTTQELQAWINTFEQQDNQSTPKHSNSRAPARLSTSGLASSSRLAYHRGQMVAVRSGKKADPFWIGRIAKVQHSRIKLRWMERAKDGSYRLLSKQNKDSISKGSIVCNNVHFTKTGKLLKQTQTTIKKNI